MRIQGNRIGGFRSSEHRFALCDHGRGRAIRAVDVKPQVIFARDVRNLRKWIEGSARGSSGARDYTKWFEIVPAVRIDRISECLHVETESIVSGNDAHAFLA